jgi:hypothetical protein
MARGSDSITLDDNAVTSLPSHTVASGGNVVVENDGSSTNPIYIDLADDGGLSRISPGQRMEFAGLTNTNQVAVKGAATYIVKFSWGA